MEPCLSPLAALVNPPSCLGDLKSALTCREGGVLQTLPAVLGPRDGRSLPCFIMRHVTCNDKVAEGCFRKGVFRKGLFRQMKSGSKIPNSGRMPAP
jgi:hypothetical protein